MEYFLFQLLQQNSLELLQLSGESRAVARRHLATNTITSVLVTNSLLLMSVGAVFLSNHARGAELPLHE